MCPLANDLEFMIAWYILDCSLSSILLMGFPIIIVLNIYLETYVKILIIRGLIYFENHLSYWLLDFYIDCLMKC